MYFPQHKLCSRETELVLKMKFYLHFHRVTWPRTRTRTLANGSAAASVARTLVAREPPGGPHLPYDDLALFFNVLDELVSLLQFFLQQYMFPAKDVDAVTALIHCKQLVKNTMTTLQHHTPSPSPTSPKARHADNIWHTIRFSLPRQRTNVSSKYRLECSTSSLVALIFLSCCLAMRESFSCLDATCRRNCWNEGDILWVHHTAGSSFTYRCTLRV